MPFTRYFSKPQLVNRKCLKVSWGRFFIPCVTCIIQSGILTSISLNINQHTSSLAIKIKFRQTKGKTYRYERLAKFPISLGISPDRRFARRDLHQLYYLVNSIRNLTLNLPNLFIKQESLHISQWQ